MRTVEWHTFVHLQIAKVVDPLKKLLQSKNDDKGAISIYRLCELGGKTVKDNCQNCDAEDKQGRKGLCWNWIMGRCTRGDTCRHVHAHPKELPDQLVTQFTTLITPLVPKKIKKVKKNPGNKRAKTGQDGSGVSVKFS